MSSRSMEEREASVASSSDFYGSDKQPDTPTAKATVKRKAVESGLSPEKRRRLESASNSSTTDLKPCAGLPPEVWQHIFLFCPLRALGRLSRVTRSFHSYLTDVRNVSNAKPGTGFLRLLKSESIWASARNMHPTKPPKPLPGFTELQMWQLVWSEKCQFCDKESSFTSGEKIWQKGPGATGVRVIWPFGVRACGPCLLDRCQTDASLLFSTASALRPALPFAFVTNDQNYIPSYTLQAATTPATVEIVKYYYKEHVGEITKELEQALGLGSAAAEEWSKGLDVRGKERMKVAENWERWEVKYQWWKDHQEPKRAISAAPSSTSTHTQSRRSPLRQPPSPVIHAPVPASKYGSIHSMTQEGSTLAHFNGVPPPVPTLTPAAPTRQYAQPRPPTIPPLAFTPQPVSGGAVPQQLRGERNLHDANEAKANRKLEIERRAQLLDPPIPPNVLRHMESFKAAIQISQPMTDYTWNMLCPRLIAQLPAAQQAETDHTSQVSSLNTRAADRRQQDASLKEVKEVLDREWEESQRPVRDRLSAIADDFIKQDWDHGRAVTYENSPKFAVDLLVYVRRRFYSEFGENEASRMQQGTKPADGADSGGPKLVLENMKWVYDNKLKPLTEQFRKELFLCYGNGCEGNTRFYGFEGVIQHFGAKHTNAFSVGNVVVAWREAEWPEETPFHPDPISAKHAYHGASSTANQGHSGYGSYYGGYSRAGTSTPHMQPQLPHASPGPYGYGGQYSGPFAPPHTPAQTVPGYDHSQVYASYHPMGPPGFGPQPSNNGYFTSPVMSNTVVVPPPPVSSQVQGRKDPTSEDTPHDGGYRTTLYDKQVSTVINMAQDLWKQTSGIKDFPNSLRVYVLLHRVISKFQIEFNHEPDLNHFVDAFSSPEIPLALKNAPGLFCKPCQNELSYPSSISYSSRSDERRTYTVLNLFSHFQSQHATSQARVSGSDQPPVPLHWQEDMIELPSDRFISGLIHAPGMNNNKLLMIATVFPRLFPTPLPRIPEVDDLRVASPVASVPKDSKEATRNGGTPGVSTEKSGPSSLASPYTASPMPPKPSEDEYDPRRPALLTEPDASHRASNRVHAYERSSPPTDRRPRYYAEPRYYVGSIQENNGKRMGANTSLPQLPRAPLEDDFPRHRDYVEFAIGPRIIRESGPVYEEHSGRRPVYREHESLYSPDEDEIIYAHPQEGIHSAQYGIHSHQIRYANDDPLRPDYREARERRSPSRGQAEAERFLEEFTPGQPSANKTSEQEPEPRTVVKPPGVDMDADDGSRYTPPPPAILSAEDGLEQGGSLSAAPHTAPSIASNGSRYEDYLPGHRQVPTPDSSGPQRRPGPSRRRDRNHDHVPWRYYRYMSVARDEPPTRAASMSRSQSKRYERYEEQRRRIDRQEVPRPNAEREYIPSYSRDQSMDQAYPEDPYSQPRRAPPRDYVPIQDRLHAYSPPRYRYAGPTEDARGPAPVYVDEFGQPIHDYEVIHVPRDHRQMRPAYAPSRHYPEHDSDHFQYVSYDRAPPLRQGGRSGEYLYYEDRPRPQPARKPGFDPESGTSYEPPPLEIKVEGAPAPVPEGP